MFEDKKITIEKVKDIIYKVQNEFSNELDFEYTSEHKKELTAQDFDIMTEYLERFTGKLELIIDDELENDKESNFHKFFGGEINFHAETMANDCDDDEKAQKYFNITDEDKEEIIKNILSDGDLDAEISNAVQYYIDKILGAKLWNNNNFFLC